MNAYQIPFNGTPTASPFNYFPQNSHSYGVISSSYGGTRTGSNHLNHSHKTTSMTSSQSPSFVTQSNYFHQSHLQPFSTFTNSVQSSANGTTAAYAHNHYSAYAGPTTGSPGTNMAPSNTQTNTHNFDYGHGGYNSAAASNAAAAASAYPYIASCSTTANNYSTYSTQNTINNNNTNSSMNTSPITNNNNTNNSANSNSNANSLTATYHTTTNPEYLNLCANTDDMYALNLNKNNEQNTQNNGSHQQNSSQHLPPIKKAKRSGRGRTRRSQINPSPSPENNIDRIFIWYIDETILTYLTISEYNRFAGFNDTLIASLYNEIFMFINKFAEKYLFLSDLKDIDQSHIDDSAADDNGQDLSNYNFTADGFKTSVSCNMGSTLNSADLRQKMALRYRKISETYTNYSDKLDELLDKSDYEQLQDLIKRFDLFTKNWIHPAVKALSFIKTRPNCLNVLISSSPLIYTLSKMLVFNLGTYFSITNVYSCAKTSKEHTLNKVLNRFGSNCTYIVIGKGSEEQQLSQKFELPFWPVTEREHFESLLNAMHYFF